MGKRIVQRVLLMSCFMVALPGFGAEGSKNDSAEEGPRLEEIPIEVKRIESTDQRGAPRLPKEQLEELHRLESLSPGHLFEFREKKSTGQRRQDRRRR